MLTFALVAYLTLAGDVHAYVLDTGLTVDDCRADLAEGVRAIDLGDSVIDLPADAFVVCELEQ